MKSGKDSIGHTAVKYQPKPPHINSTCPVYHRQFPSKDIDAVPFTDFMPEVVNPPNPQVNPDLQNQSSVSYKNPTDLRTENKTPLSQHEITHIMITTDDLKRGVGLLTSAKKAKPDFTPTVIDSVNYKGENKHQSVAPFKYPRGFIIRNCYLRPNDNQI
jgi:hypothetical protein